jgi:hypothetical protein
MGFTVGLSGTCLGTTLQSLGLPCAIEATLNDFRP